MNSVTLGVKKGLVSQTHKETTTNISASKPSLFRKASLKAHYLAAISTTLLPLSEIKNT
jgi:hypothetical protein